MKLFPAIDLFGSKAVRLLKGDYAKMTVYSDNPLEIAKDFENSGAKYIHLVDLEGAKSGETPNFDTVIKIVSNTSLFSEIGGGIRDMKTVAKYIDGGVNSVILGTAAVNDESFLKEAVEKYGEKIAVGVDIKDGFVAIKGWTKASDLDAFTFCEKLEKMGIGTVIQGLGYLFMVAAVLQRDASATHQSSMIWVALVYLSCTIGELWLSPVALSFITATAPKQMTSSPGFTFRTSETSTVV